ncbi:MAG: hypothetical protein LBR80_05020 [Deltaproteobacteria bacterium]|jgi:hypothetical protein|nr:hypothetical protein [Deltaproteobacteria bacterium]
MLDFGFQGKFFASRVRAAGSKMDVPPTEQHKIMTDAASGCRMSGAEKDQNQQKETQKAIRVTFDLVAS